MPIYAYQCGSCGNEFDLKQGFDASTETQCPECNNTAKRQFVAPTVIYKGSGFYTTDYARKNVSSPASSSTSSSSESKTESKPAESKAGDSSGGESKSKAPSESK